MTTLTQRLERAVNDKGLSIGDAWNLLSEALEYIERLEAICASVYQYVGIDASVRFLDALALHDEYMQMPPDQIIETLLPTWKADPADAALSAQRGGECP